MVRIALCDDERRMLDEASAHIARYAETRGKEIEISCFDSALSLLGSLEDGRSFDVFVLDVYIGDEMGTALARDLRKR